MANRKITELTELTEVNDDDLLVIVDVANDETKKVKAKNVGTGKGGAEIPIQDTPPANPEEDDLWIDTSEPEEMQEAIVNEYSESASNTYSCNYINGIIESGSNANGDYTKFADGTMICTGTKSGSTSWSDWWGFAKRSPEGNEALSATFPQEFINNNISLSLTPSHGNDIFSASYIGITTTSFSYICYKPSNVSSTNYEIKYIAIGRWK